MGIGNWASSLQNKCKSALGSFRIGKTFDLLIGKKQLSQFRCLNAWKCVECWAWESLNYFWQNSAHRHLRATPLCQCPCKSVAWAIDIFFQLIPAIIWWSYFGCISHKLTRMTKGILNPWVIYLDIKKLFHHKHLESYTWWSLVNAQWIASTHIH